MNQKEKNEAQELVDGFKGIVYPYLGSSMLTNDQNDDVILDNAKTCANIVADKMIYELSDLPRIPYNERRTDYWRIVKLEINNVTE